MRRRQRVEQDLAEALAFRKAMEDSLVTGLRARDLPAASPMSTRRSARWWASRAEELLGHSTPSPYWPPELAGEYQKRQEIRLAGQHAPPREGFESVFMRKDGSRFPVLIIEAPLINAQGVQTGWMSAFLDISEQRRVEELSRASQERLQATARLATVGEMASLLSHELNQPLAAISSYATGSLNLLRCARRRRPASRPTCSWPCGASREQAERAGRVIKSVHDFVRRRDKAREPVRAAGADRRRAAAGQPAGAQAAACRCETRVPADAAAGAVRPHHGRTGAAQPGAQRDAGDGRGPACASRSLVIQVRRAGARRARSRQGLDGVLGGRPWARASRPRWREQLFTPFFTTKAEGMGLGLSLCRTVVEQHGGFLAFEPNRPRGTIFRFTLPADAGAARAAASTRPST